MDFDEGLQIRLKDLFVICTGTAIIAPQLETATPVFHKQGDSAYCIIGRVIHQCVCHPMDGRPGCRPVANSPLSSLAVTSTSRFLKDLGQ